MYIVPAHVPSCRMHISGCLSPQGHSSVRLVLLLGCGQGMLCASRHLDQISAHAMCTGAASTKLPAAQRDAVVRTHLLPPLHHRPAALPA